MKTGAIVWELPQTGPASFWGSTLATATGLVFFGQDSGGALWKASPVTPMFDGKQHIAVASGPNIISFALVE